MKLRILLLCLVMLPTLASAEIYKWKDKDGRVRYSDVPPPSNVQQEALYGKKIPKPKTAAPLAPVNGDITNAIERQKAAGKEGTLSKEEATKNVARMLKKRKKRLLLNRLNWTIERKIVKLHKPT